MTARDDRPAHAAPNAIRQAMNLGNVSAALIGLGASIVLAFLLPPLLYKVVVAAAAIFAVIYIVAAVYRRMGLGAPADETTRR